MVVAGRQYLGPDNFVTLNVSYGHGSGEDIMAFAGSDANAVLTPENQLQTLPSFAFVVGGMHRWTDQLATNASVAYGWLDTPEARDGLALKRGGTGHLNLIWQFTPEAAAGIEYMLGAQRVTNGATGLASRLQAMIRFDF